MTTDIMNCLVKMVYDALCRDIDEDTSTNIGYEEKLTTFKREDLWVTAMRKGMFQKDDIGDNGEILEMEDIWAGMIENAVKYHFPNFKMI